MSFDFVVIQLAVLNADLFNRISDFVGFIGLNRFNAVVVIASDLYVVGQQHTGEGIGVGGRGVSRARDRSVYFARNGQGIALSLE